MSVEEDDVKDDSDLVTPDFAALFRHLPSPYMILDRQLTFVDANAAYCAVTERRMDELMGRGIFELFPNPDESGRRLRESFERVLATGVPDSIPLLPYPIALPLSAGGGVEMRYWSCVHTPLLDATGATRFIVQNTVDVTELQRLKQIAFGPEADPAPGEADLLQRAQEVQALNATLTEETRGLRDLFMQAPGFIAVLTGSDLTVTLVNHAYQQLIGHRQVIGRPMAHALPEVVDQGFIEMLESVMARREAFIGEAVSARLQRTPDGPLEERFLDFVFQPILMPDGEASGIFVQGNDVTDRVLAERQQKLLVDELNHRVKNTLATVQAIAQQTLRATPTPADFREGFESRLMALSATHDLLTAAGWRAADLRDVLLVELRPFSVERYAIRGESVDLSPAEAVALGLVFHELATNAAKYGALASSEGRIDVHWTRTDRQLHLTWTETGGPLVSEPTRRGFGSRLIERSLQGQLAGDAQLDFKPGRPSLPDLPAIERSSLSCATRTGSARNCGRRQMFLAPLRDMALAKPHQGPREANHMTDLDPPARAASAAPPIVPAMGAPVRVCFFFNAQRHQLLHGISTAVEIARRAGYEAHVWSPSEDHVAYARQVADSLGGAPIVYSVVNPRLLDLLRRATGASVPPKVLSLALLARRLNRFDAIAVPERTSILLRRLGATAPFYVHLDHGAGDRAAGFDPRIRDFDLVLMAGEKHRERMAREGLIHPGRHAVVGYPKFEAADAVRDPAWRPFANAKPIVLYNPHFSDLGSWASFGEPLLQAFAAQDRYNLIVAPHVRMLDGKAQRARWRALINAYADCDSIHIDAGSDRCIDMTYTTLADIYVGDVSSQVYEFLRTPRPCIFLDAHSVEWAKDENYAHWRFGPVVRSPGLLLEAVDHAVVSHWRFLEPQIRGFDETFTPGAAPASARAADAITTFLAHRPRAMRPTGRIKEGLRRAATLAIAAGMGWMAHDELSERAGLQPGGPGFVEEAVTSHRTTLIRAAMKSQPEIQQLDPVEIQAATGIRVPRLPPSLKLADVQIYPSDWGPIVQIAAVTQRGEHVSLVAMRIDTPADGKPILQNHKGDRVAYWEEDGQAYGVVGAIPAKRLLRIAAELAQDTAHAPERAGESRS